MMRKRYYEYRFSNDEIKFFTPNEAWEYAQANNVSMTKDGLKDSINSPRKMVKDGFESGYNPALGRYIRGRKHLGQVCKELGVVEAGNEDISRQAPIRDKPIIDDTILKTINDNDFEVGSVLEKEIKSFQAKGVQIPPT